MPGVVSRGFGGEDRVAVLTVAEMHSCISKADTCQSCGEEHFTLRLKIVRIGDSAR